MSFIPNLSFSHDPQYPFCISSSSCRFVAHVCFPNRRGAPGRTDVHPHLCPAFKQTEVKPYLRFHLCLYYIPFTGSAGMDVGTTDNFWSGIFLFHKAPPFKISLVLTFCYEAGRRQRRPSHDVTIQSCCSSAARLGSKCMRRRRLWANCGSSCCKARS